MSTEQLEAGVDAKAGASTFCRRGDHRTCETARARCACFCHGRAGQAPPDPPKETVLANATTSPPVLHAVKDHRCDDCGDSFKGPQGLGAHRRHAHGVKGSAGARKPARRAPGRRTSTPRKSATPAAPPPDTESVIRADERARLADLLEAHGAALSAFTDSPQQTVELVVHLLRLSS